MKYLIIAFMVIGCSQQKQLPTFHDFRPVWRLDTINVIHPDSVGLRWVVMPGVQQDDTLYWKIGGKMPIELHKPADIPPIAVSSDGRIVIPSNGARPDTVKSKILLYDTIARTFKYKK